MSKELIETARGQDYVMQYKFVAEMKENKVVWHDEKNCLAKGRNVVVSASTYIDVHDISGDVIHSRKVFLYPEEIKKLYTRLMELEAGEIIKEIDDDLPF